MSDERNVVVPALVIEAARAGEAGDCGDRDGRGTAAADLLRTLGLHLRNAVVTGDLGAMSVPFPLTFEGCRFEASLQVSGATLQEMALSRCELPRLLGNGVDVRRDLNLCRIIVRDATVTAADRSPGMNYADHGVRGSAIGASRLSVGSDLLFEGACRLDGRVDLALATLGRLTVGPECPFDAHGNTALDLTNAALASRLGFAPGVDMRGTLRLTGATVHGTLTLEGLHLSDPSGRSCLAAQSTTIYGDVELH